MIAQGALRYLIPEMENHPDQRYSVSSVSLDKCTTISETGEL
jgi:hypothetical protein